MGVFVDPVFGTVSRPDLVAAAREAGDDVDVLIACAFNYEAHATDFSTLARIRVLKAHERRSPHGGGPQEHGQRNLSVIFGEPDIEALHAKDDRMRVEVKGVDVFKPHLGRVESSNVDEIAC